MDNERRNIMDLLLTSPSLKKFTVIEDGDFFRWRVDLPNRSGKIATVSNTRYYTRQMAEQAASEVANWERPSICILGGGEK